jgi:hypothetical protein
VISPDPPSWLYRNKDEGSGTLTRYPDRGEIPLPVPAEERRVLRVANYPRSGA